MPQVHYRGINRTVQAEEHTSLLTASISNQINHLHECGGNGQCTTCRVRVVSGHDNLTEPTPIEKEFYERRRWDPAIRLACQSHITGDVEIERLLWTGPEINPIQLEVLPEGTAQERSVAILCCDMRGFTRITAQLMTFDTAHLLNRFYTALGDPILMNNGIIYQYVGDEIVGVFGVAGGDPAEHCLSAVRAAIGMQFAANRLNRYELEAFDIDLRIGIGIAYGQAYVGHLGHPKHRQFAVIGETMNIASRIQGATKETGCGFLISEDLCQTLPDETLNIGTQHVVQLAGGTGTKTVFEVLSLKQMDMHLELQSTLDIILKNEEQFAATFYNRLFSTLPQARRLFRKGMREQGRLLMHMLGSIVYSLSRPQFLKMGLRSLGRSHAGYGVKAEYYPVMVDVLLECITEELGKDVTDSTLQAWEDALNYVTEVMQDAASKVVPTP